MPSDRARVSYDPTRQYRGVIAQQGRVTLEADWNEAQVIAGEELCQETLDIVGPSGTPDDGYRVLEGALPRHHFDFRVQQGTMYVGGERVSLSAPLRYGQQEEWLNHAGDPVWVTPRAVGRRKNRREFIYLFLREQEVSAVEDQALKDVALGGPDTDQRARLIQRVVRVATRARDCQGALVEAEKRWATQGLSFSPTTMQLSSGSTLKASFTQPVTEPSLCEPEASGGYLGAENQLIRVQISGLAEDGRPRLLWAYDNASFLYRVVVDPPGGQTLRLLQRPVDDYHMPRAGQAVEVLRSSVRLDGEDYVAAATGAVFTLTTAYDPTTQTVQLPGSLLDDYRDKSKTPQLFLRVWEREETVGTDGSLELTSDLGSTGLKVTLQADDGYHVGDYWEIAVRPSTPDDVYPRRYLEDFQPPDGPRQWACPLAVIEWDDDRLRVVEDCRNPFDNLVELARRRTGCCDVTVRPEDLHGGRTLQSIIDGVPEGERATICLMSGTYELPAPLRLGPEHSHLTIEACHDGAVLRAAPGQEHKFSQGLVLLNRANEVTLRGLRFRLPEPPTRARRVGIRPPFSLPGTWLTSIGVLAFHCAELTVENCLFRYSITREASLISAGILAMSECWRHTIRGNRFLREEFDIAAARGGPYRILVGYLLASSLQLPSKNGRTDNEAASEGTVVPALLEDATFRDNQFTNLAFPVLVLADAGAVTIEDNTVRGCYAGFLLFSPGTSYLLVALIGILNRVVVAREASKTAGRIRDAIFAPMLDPILMRTSVLARLIPLDPAFDTSHAIEVPAGEAAVDAEEQAAYLQEIFDQVLPRFGPRYRRQAGVSEVPLDEAGGPEPGAVAADLEGEQEAFHDAHLQLAALERTALAAKEESGRAQLALHAANNEIDLLLPENRASLLGLLVARVPQDVVGDIPRDELRSPPRGDPESLVTMSANTVRTRTELLPAVVLYGAQYCAVTGNVLLNEAEARRPSSLMVVPGKFGAGIGPGEVQARTATVAITGNVCRGDLLVPQRNLPAPLNAWDALNTVFL